MNLFYEVRIRPPSTGGRYTSTDSVDAVADIYLEELKQKGRHFPKTIFYSKLVYCGYIHNRAVSKFLEDHPHETTVQH